ncbi:hypothetical protein [Streptomyces sp. SPB162]|uniref:hypothetical protein n=1 Tax=Streptomyces sp. SPB162 TaxID=2940560 RepID=UPI0024077175|nr:hypothetical protein [Streptomyces sp. SPB162]MDF9812218.1 hypothetical protein [Streptomyces sp. SPB162]
MSTGVENGPGQPSPPQPPAFPALYPTTPPRPVHRPAAREPIAARGPQDRSQGAPPAPPTAPPTPATPPHPTEAPPPAAAPSPFLSRHPEPPRPAMPPPQGHSWDEPGSAPPPASVPFTVPAPPARPPRTAAGRTAAALCLVLGLGLFTGAATGALINHDPAAVGTTQSAYARAGELWHSVPVDTLLPPVVRRPGAGPGGADRTYTRVGVAPAAGCAGAFDPLLAKVLAPVGCVQVVRATYVDATSSRVTTVGLLVTGGDAAGMAALNRRWSTEHLGSRTDLMPRPVAFPGTAAASFGDAQRASWTVSVSATLPVVVYAVSGFADGRRVPEPQPADVASAPGATSAPAQAGLGTDALVLTADLDARLRRSVSADTTSTREAS